ncbi:phosphoadenosine phosphosulfate reductase family protein [Pyrofollis japonicus]|uniref:phosphoadenosine phosphosulfate reductase domain-containing protein n=1 Tax=Pyrofollis japonicus TaxID=3060460 RepID=UPI00295ADD6A|nr:phosphoadenosine phosphosulfate reductase family protein [Pyrofollis japonicus]BEP17475.1 phosphoadenosine phosphosulfate reductase family protein [Pyrofollis japonicus]
MSSRNGFDGIIKALEQLGYRRHPAVPVIGCRGSKACWRVRGDYWLAGRFEKNTLSRLIRRHFDVFLDLDNHHVVFHRIPAPTGEYAVEVFAHAVRIGVLEYGSKGWILHPSGALASVLASIGANYLQASSDKGRRLKGKKLRLGGEACNRKDWVLVGTDKWIGPAKVIDKENCIVKIKDLAPLGFKPLSPSEIDEAVEANTEIIGALASEAREFIRRVYARFQASRGKLYVAFSGGADSTALLELAREAVGGGNVVAVYVDTGMEHPETKAYVEKIVSIIGVDLEVVSAKLDPVELIARQGFMTRDNRWCTRLLKLEPLKEFYEKHGVRLVLDGARKWESTTRAKTPRLGENPLIPGVVRALPIYHWPRLAVQLFLAERNLPVNQLYNEGLVRIGCMACPAMHLYELHISYRNHKDWFYRLAEKIAGSTKDDVINTLATILRGRWRYGVSG